MIVPSYAALEDEGRQRRLWTQQLPSNRSEKEKKAKFLRFWMVVFVLRQIYIGGPRRHDDADPRNPMSEVPSCQFPSR